MSRGTVGAAVFLSWVAPGRGGGGSGVIGRGAWRGKGESSVGGGLFKKKKRRQGRRLIISNQQIRKKVSRGITVVGGQWRGFFAWRQDGEQRLVRIVKTVAVGQAGRRSN